jgi:photosystem II stability/assembly factor-like uncharacterized protein
LGVTAERRRWLAPLGLALTIGLAACAPFGSGQGSAGAIVVPGPASPVAEPTPLQGNPNIKHLHAIATRGGSEPLVLATHQGTEVMSATGKVVTASLDALKGDVLEVAFGTRGRLYASGHNLGVQVSLDTGGTWQPVSRQVAGLDVHGMAINPHDPTQMYIYAVGKGILFSIDAGATWAHVPGYADTHYLTGLAITADGTLLAGSPELGIAASPDHGGTFDSVRTGPAQVFCLAASATDPNIVVAATDTGIFLTTNGGKDWQVGVSAEIVTAVGIDPTNPNRIFAGGVDGAVFVSTDGGQNFAPITG